MGSVRYPSAVLQALCTGTNNVNSITDTNIPGTVKTRNALASGAAAICFTTDIKNTNAGLYMYQGAIPTQAQVDAWDTPTASFVDSRSTDRLVYFAGIAASQAGRNLSVTLAAANAVKTGSATWFMLVSTGIVSGLTVCNVVVGSLTLVGGGGDIEVGSVDYVLGQSYKVPQITLAMPVKFLA